MRPLSWFHSQNRANYGGGSSRIWSSGGRRACGRSAATAPSAQTWRRVRPGWVCTAEAASPGWGAQGGLCICKISWKIRTGLAGWKRFITHVFYCSIIGNAEKTKLDASFELFRPLIELERERTIITLLLDSLRRHGEHGAMTCLAHRDPLTLPPQFQKSPVFLLFLKLLHGALVREHRGDGRKYLIAGDLLAAGRVPHFWRQERSTAGYANRHGHQELIENHKQWCFSSVKMWGLSRERLTTTTTEYVMN